MGIVFISYSLNAQTLFQYRHRSGEKWHLTSQITEDILYDGDLYRQVEILNKISVEVLRATNNDGFIRNRYQISERTLDGDVYNWSKDYDVSYGRDKQGRISGLKKDTPVPFVRNVPVYPKDPISVGYTWKEPGQEYFNLEQTFGISEIIEIHFLAHYEYLKQELLEGRNIEKIGIQYKYRWEPDLLLFQRMKQYTLYPINITGQFTQYVYWDSQAGRNYGEEGEFEYAYTMNDGHIYTFRGISRGKAVYTEPMDKDGIAEEFKYVEGAGIKATEEGISITFDNIHFIPDKAEILPGEEHKLNHITKILARIRNRDILIIGHTAKVSGSADGMQLSEQRAKAVAQYFIDSGIRDATQVVTQGMGNTKPVASNNTEEGRKRNRRVEIIILEN